MAAISKFKMAATLLDMQFSIAILSTCACYKFKASYLSDTQCGPCRYITDSLGCLPSLTSNVWKFRLYFY